MRGPLFCPQEKLRERWPDREAAGTMAKPAGEEAETVAVNPERVFGVYKSKKEDRNGENF